MRARLVMAPRPTSPASALSPTKRKIRTDNAAPGAVEERRTRRGVVSAPSRRAGPRRRVKDPNAATQQRGNAATRPGATSRCRPAIRRLLLRRTQLRGPPSSERHSAAAAAARIDESRSGQLSRMREGTRDIAWMRKNEPNDASHKCSVGPDPDSFDSNNRHAVTACRGVRRRHAQHEQRRTARSDSERSGARSSEARGQTSLQRCLAVDGEERL